MSTLDNISDWVLSNYLNRPNDTVTQAITREAALSVYKAVCAAVPFDELMTTSGELALVAGTSSYALAGAPWNLAPAIRAIANIRITFDTSTKRRLRRSHVRVYDSLSYSANSRSATYARWGNTIELNPPPDSNNYTLRFRYWSRPTIIASPNEHTTTIVTPTEWDWLLKWEAAFQTLCMLDQVDKAMTLVTPSMLPPGPSPKQRRMTEVGIIPRLWNNLLTTVSAKEDVDEDFSINPLRRNYSVR